MAIILIVEDDNNLRLLMNQRLSPFYDLLNAENGTQALNTLYSRHVDLMVSDVMMPEMDGFSLLRNIRQNGLNLPVLLLTAKDSFDDKQTGFVIGTDDYMTKPVNFDELRWRIDALMRRANIASRRKICIDEVILDETEYTISKGESRLELPQKEFRLLYKLLSYPGRIFTKNQLLNEIWGYTSESSEDTVKTHISRLRGKVSRFTEFQIITIKGLGYKAEITSEKKNQAKTRKD